MQASATVCLCTTITAATLVAYAGEQPQTFKIVEHFGVPYPDQIVDFEVKAPVKDPPNTAMYGPGGSKVPYQIIENGTKVAVRTDLPANATKTWTLKPDDKPIITPDDVKVTENGKLYDITNALIGVRIPRGLPSQEKLAPIQGVRYRDGTWTGTGPNPLSSAKSLAVEFAERGPIKTVAKLTYAYPDGSTYTSTIDVQANQPSIVIIEETNERQLSYEFNITKGLNPDRLRRRHHLHAPHDGPGPETEENLRGNIERRLYIHDIWDESGGWQISLFKASAPPGANMFGLFQGPCINMVDASRNTGTRFVYKNGQAKVRIQTAYAETRHQKYSWGIFLGRRSDIRPKHKIQSIDFQRNLHGGLNLNKFHRLDYDIPTPPGGFGAMYMTPAAMNWLRNKVCTDDDYYNWVRSAEGYFVPMLEMWRDTTGSKLRSNADAAASKAREFLNTLMYKHGMYDKTVHYYEGWFNCHNQFMRADQILASPLATPEDKTKCKRAIVLLASVFTDNNHYPYPYTQSGAPSGTYNQGLSYCVVRDQVIAYLKDHPQFKAMYPGLVDRIAGVITYQINEHGAHMSGNHYVEASFDSAMTLALLLKQRGIHDFFANDSKLGYRLTKFSECMMNMLTPDEPRFNSGRKMFALGHGSTEAADRYGIAATGFVDCNPKLAKRLMGAWRQNGKRHGSQWASSIVKIDDRQADEDPAMGSAHYQGSMSVLRQGWGTPNESVVWFVNGSFLKDHRERDNQEVVIYALKCPLAVDFGNMYSPQAPGADRHSVVYSNGFSGEVHEAFAKQTDGAYARARCKVNSGTWTRAVSLCMLQSDLPVVAIQDSFNKPARRTVQLNMMAAGALSTPAGKKKVGDRVRLKAGVSRLGVTGQSWHKHATGGIDWDVYVVAPSPLTASIASWGHKWHPTPERKQFQKANGRPFKETQHLLRLTGNDSFRMFVVAYAKGTSPDVDVKQDGDDVLISSGGKTVRFKPDGTYTK